ALVASKAMRNGYFVLSVGVAAVLLWQALGLPAELGPYALFGISMLAGGIFAASQVVYYRTGGDWQGRTAHQQFGAHAALPRGRDDAGAAGREGRRDAADDRCHRTGALFALAGGGIPHRARLRRGARGRVPLSGRMRFQRLGAGSARTVRRASP